MWKHIFGKSNIMCHRGSCVRFIQEVNFPSQLRCLWIIQSVQCKCWEFIMWEAAYIYYIYVALCVCVCGKRASHMKCKHLWLTWRLTADILLLINIFHSFLTFIITLETDMRLACSLSIKSFVFDHGLRYNVPQIIQSGVLI